VGSVATRLFVELRNIDMSVGIEVVDMGLRYGVVSMTTRALLGCLVNMYMIDVPYM
jgi:hypothetical protein